MAAFGMRSIRFRLALLISGSVLCAVAAAAGLVLALRVMDATLDHALDAQRRLDLLTEVSGSLTSFGLAAIDSAARTDRRRDRMDEARSRFEATTNAVEKALAEAVEEARGALNRTEMAARSRPLAQLQAGFRILDRQIAQALEQPDAQPRSDAIRGAFNAFGATVGPFLSFLIQAERRGVEAARDDERRLSRRLAEAAVLATLAALALALILHRLISRPLLARIASIRRAASAIGRGELDMRLPIGSRDEFGLLIAVFNRMAGRLRRREARVVADRLALEQIVAERTADLTAANGRLAEIDRSRRRFFADVSHELRTPLTVVLGECEIALRTATVPEAQYRSALGIIRKRAQRLHRRVEDLLRVARSESGQIELDFRPTGLIPLIDSAIESFEAAARRKGVDLSWRAPEHEIEVTADGEWLRQTVEGFIDNALRHADGASYIHVGLRARGDTVEIAVNDDGRGFPAESELLFTRFSRRASDDAGGFGIGLALARWVVEQHKGHIALESTDQSGKGATVVITLPKGARGEAPQ